MTTEVTTKSSLLTERDEAVTNWIAADKAMRTAQSTERGAPKPSVARTIARKERLSQGAKKANRIKEIRQAELSMRLAGESYTAWVEPEAPASPSRLLPMTQAEIESNLKAVRALKATLTDSEASVIHDCEVRIRGLLKSAEARGYKVS